MITTATPIRILLRLRDSCWQEDLAFYWISDQSNWRVETCKLDKNGKPLDQRSDKIELERNPMSLRLLVSGGHFGIFIVAVCTF